jgi:hypothetical protein
MELVEQWTISYIRLPHKKPAGNPSVRLKLQRKEYQRKAKKVLAQWYPSRYVNDRCEKLLTLAETRSE